MQKTGLLPRHKEILIERYLPLAQLILDRPTVVLDKFGVIVLWYLPGAIDEAIQVGVRQSPMMFVDFHRMI